MLKGKLMRIILNIMLVILFIFFSNINSVASIFDFFSRSSSNESSMFRANLSRTGEYGSNGPKELTELIFKFKTGDRVESSPAVSGGVVYFGSFDNCLYAVK